MSHILEFVGPYSFLSNFHLSPFLLDLRVWPTVEHYFQAMKYSAEFRRDEVRCAATPGEAKKMGRHAALPANWDALKNEIMLRGLNAKFQPGTGLSELLDTTGDATLCEGNHWHDNYWGNCTCGRAACKQPGWNYLGMFLMSVRLVLRQGSIHYTQDDLIALKMPDINY